MVGAGVTKHPQQWINSGYHEIQKPKERYYLLWPAPLSFSFPKLHHQSYQK
jgi:hypothetical protein